jgi:hypothetical protein
VLARSSAERNSLLDPIRSEQHTSRATKPQIQIRPESLTFQCSAQLRANTALLRVRLIVLPPAAPPMRKSVRRQQATPHEQKDLLMWMRQK